MADDNQKSELVDRVCHRIKDRFLARDAGTPGWWTPLVGCVMPDDTIAVRGAWPLQRHLLGRIIASFGSSTEAVLRGPAALLDGVFEEAIAVGADVPRERISLGHVRGDEWNRLTEAAGRMDAARFELERVEHLAGIELRARARWFFGMSVVHADVEIEIVDADGDISLVIVDGRSMPPTWRRSDIALSVTPWASEAAASARTRSVVDEE